MPEKKPLTAWEKQMLELIMKKLKPTIDDAIAKAEAKLREDIGPDGLSAIGKLGARIDKLLTDGLPPIPPKVTKLLAGAVALLAGVGLYQRAKS
jgi:hypothetical protein